MEGWTNAQLHYIENEWRIYSNSGVAFVPLFRAEQRLIELCHGAKDQLEKELNKPF